MADEAKTDRDLAPSEPKSAEEKSTGWRVQMRRQIAHLPYDEQVQALAPAEPGSTSGVGQAIGTDGSIIPATGSDAGDSSGRDSEGDGGGERRATTQLKPEAQEARSEKGSDPKKSFPKVKDEIGPELEKKEAEIASGEAKATLRFHARALAGGQIGFGPPELIIESAAAAADEGISVAGAGTVSMEQSSDISSGQLGVVLYDSNAFTFPDLKFDTKKTGDKSWTTKIQSTTSADVAHRATATPEGEYHIGFIERNVRGNTWTIEVLWKVSAAISNLVKTAEEEHLADLLQAYNISIKAAADVVNGLKEKEFGGTSQDEAEQAAKDAVAKKLPEKMGADPAKWKQCCKLLCDLTLERDTAGWHTFSDDVSKVEYKFPTDKRQLAARLATAIVPVTDDGTNIGTVSAAQHVNFGKI